jgi:rhodanese-related sulfurtransferase
VSQRAAERLVDLGYRNVMEYPGGIKEWRAVMGKLERSAPIEPSPQP